MKKIRVPQATIRPGVSRLLPGDAARWAILGGAATVVVAVMSSGSSVQVRLAAAQQFHLHDGDGGKDQEQHGGKRGCIAEVRAVEGSLDDVDLDHPGGVDRTTAGGHGDGVEHLE